MQIDGYHACPCHSEKKIKFCCGKDIVQDLNQLLSKQRAGQELAALEEVERAIKKHGAQDCLLTMKTQLLLAHGDLEKALEVNQQFLAKNPQHPAGYHQLALLLLESRDVTGAVEALQTAVDAVKGNELPVFLTAGFRMVGIALFISGLPLAARAHFKFASYLAGDQDQDLQKLFFRTFHGENLSFLLRQDWELEEPEDSQRQEDWAKKISTAMRGVTRGQFRKSLKYLELANEATPNNVHLLRAIAIVSGYLSNSEKTCAQWLRYSEFPGLDDIKSIEAANMANLHHSNQSTNTLQVFQETLEVKDFNAVLELAASLNKLVLFESPESSPDDDSPPPRKVYLILDKPHKKEGVILPEDVSSIVGTVYCYGKQTDREARLVWEYQNTPHIIEKIREVQPEFEVFRLGSQDASPISKETVPIGFIVMDWSFPTQISVAEKSRILPDLVYKKLVEWTQRPMTFLANKTPQEAARIPELHNRLKAILFSLQVDILNYELHDSYFERLWNFLELSPPPKTTLGGRNVAYISSLEFACLPVNELDNDELNRAAMLAYAMQLKVSLRRILLELLNRPETESQMPRHEILQLLTELEPDVGTALDYFAQARTKAAKAGVPVGNYLVDEFDYRLSHGITDNLESLLNLICSGHLSEPQVLDRISQVLSRHGLDVTPQGVQASRGVPRGTPASRTDSSDATVGSETTGSSKLWLPD